MLSVAALEAFDAAIAAGGTESDIFARALAWTPGDAALHRHVAARAYADAAIAIHRALAPSHGYQFGETAARRGLASTWRSGDAQARPFEAATPGLALLRASVHAAANLARERLQSGCPTCEGLGWFITPRGRKRICGHESKS